MVKKVLLGIVAVIVIGLIVAYFARNVIVANAVEEGSNRALGVPTEVGSASVAIGAGSVELNGYQVDNPEPFESGKFFTFSRAVLDVDAGSVFDDLVVVDSFVIEGVRLNLRIEDMKSNFKAVLDNIKEMAAQPSSEGEQAFRVQYLALRDIKADASLSVGGKTQAEQSFAVENIELRDVGSESGATIAELTSKVVSVVIEKAVASGKLPGNFPTTLEGLRERTKEQVKEKVDEKLKDAAESLLGGNK